MQILLYTIFDGENISWYSSTRTNNEFFTNLQNFLHSLRHSPCVYF